jgi:hypothetical protein
MSESGFPLKQGLAKLIVLSALELPGVTAGRAIRKEVPNEQLPSQLYPRSSR